MNANLVTRLFASLLIAAGTATMLWLARDTQAAPQTRTVTVDTTADEDVNNGSCSLREAIQAVNIDANYNGCSLSSTGTDYVIQFNLGTGTPTISVTQPLPDVQKRTTINGATGGATRVEVAAAASIARGIEFFGGDPSFSVLRSMVINGFTYQVSLNSGAHITVEGNLLGLDPTGTFVKGSSYTGIEMCGVCGSSAHLIGGTTPAQRNVIAGSSTGIAMDSSTGVAILGNYIGTNITGTARLGGPNFNGVSVFNAHYNTIGSAGAGGNVIVGMLGIFVGGNQAHTRSTGNVIRGNYIGTNAAGTIALAPGTGNGVDLNHADATIIGGPAAGDGNVIAGHYNGIEDGGTSAIASWAIQGNRIGTNAAGNGALGNSGHGIYVFGSATPYSGTIVNNIIAYNAQNGTRIQCDCTVLISQNSIHSNGGIGIDLGPFGVTPNDPGDADTGANGLQNYPVLTGTRYAAGTTTITGTLNSLTNTTFTLEFFANTSCHPSLHGEGQTYLGSQNVTTVGNDATFVASFPSADTSQLTLTATATDPNGNTSEFSSCLVPPYRVLLPLVVR